MLCQRFQLASELFVPFGEPLLALRQLFLIGIRVRLLPLDLLCIARDLLRLPLRLFDRLRGRWLLAEQFFPRLLSEAGRLLL